MYIHTHIYFKGWKENDDIAVDVTKQKRNNNKYYSSFFKYTHTHIYIYIYRCFFEREKSCFECWDTLKNGYYIFIYF